MKRSLPKISVLAIAAIILFSGNASAQTVARGAREDEEAIKRVVVAMTDAFNAHEPNASLFTKDANFVNVNGTWLKGAAEIESGRRAAFETILKRASAKLVDIRIRFIRPDVAVAHVVNETSGMTGSDGRELPPQQELNVRVLTKEDGKWLVTAFQNTPMRR